MDRALLGYEPVTVFETISCLSVFILTLRGFRGMAKMK
jgi:hypothetical protein